jgi:hypothetical protein
MVEPESLDHIREQIQNCHGRYHLAQRPYPLPRPNRPATGISSVSPR